MSSKESVYRMIGASNHTEEERQSEDYYATDPIAIDVLLKGGASIDHNVYEPFCGEGHLSKRLEEHGFNVKSTDLIDRGFGEGGINFFDQTEMFDGDIVTNPPYSEAKRAVEHALELIPEGHKVFMFLKLTFLEGKARRKLFDKKCLKTVWVSTSRINCAKNGDFEKLKISGGTALAQAWFEFEKGYYGDPVIKWIN